MTFSDIRTKILTYWWVLLIAILASNGLLLQKASTPSYLASSTVGLSTNSQLFQNSAALPSSTIATNYDAMLKEFSLYLVSRFQSPDIQSLLAKKLNISPTIDMKKPFYEVKGQNAGFVTISSSQSSEKGGIDFNNAVSDIFNETIIGEWNKGRPALFTIENTDKSRSFTSTVYKNESSIQTSILPSIVGLLVGVFIILLLPIRKIN
jgi:hypothetical protein